jgi:Na+-driven multidrug efflux pump
MEDKKSYLILKEKNLYKAFLILALPVFFANLLKSVHDLVDTYFIGGLENSVDAQAGISITWPLINIFLSFSVGLSIAGVALISQLIGAKKEENAKYPDEALIKRIKAAIAVKQRQVEMYSGTDR